MSNSKDAKWIANAIDLAMSACETISEKNHCSECTMFATCLMETPFEQVVADTPTSAWSDLLDMSYELIDWVSDEDAQAIHDDSERDFYADMALEEI